MTNDQRFEFIMNQFCERQNIIYADIKKKPIWSNEVNLTIIQVVYILKMVENEFGIRFDLNSFHKEFETLEDLKDHVSDII